MCIRDRNGGLKNGNTYYGYKLPLGADKGGPLFLSQYSFLGINPKGLKDKYADYWEQNQNHTLINYNYCKENPKGYAGYGASCWGVTASDGDNGYSAHSPTNDKGVIAPTAALSAFPYTPEESMSALHFYYYKMGDKLWRDYGFVDAFNLTANWYDNQCIDVYKRQMLKFYNYNLDFVCEPGDFEVMIGGDSRDVNKALFSLQ